MVSTILQNNLVGWSIIEDVTLPSLAITDLGKLNVCIQRHVCRSVRRIAARDSINLEATQMSLYWRVDATGPSCCNYLT